MYQADFSSSSKAARKSDGSRSGETQTAEYIRLNPSRKIPTLQDGDYVISESAAIVSYLAETYGAAKNLLLPVGSRERAHYYQWCFFLMMELDANTLYIIRRHEDLKDIYGDAPNAVKAARRCFEEQAHAAAQRLAAAGGEYVLGDRFSAADVLLTTCLTGAQRRDMALPESLRDYLKRITARPAYQKALQANQPSQRTVT